MEQLAWAQAEQQQKHHHQSEPFQIFGVAIVWVQD